jgi:feruloyl esterase
MMRHLEFPWFRLLAAAIPLTAGASGAYADDCLGLTGEDFGDAHIISTEEVTSPITIRSSDPFTPGEGVRITTPFCRVQGVIRPTTDSEIRIELWLPAAAAWNGKYESVGNGGFAGILIYPPMVWALESGYAVSSTDTGHIAEMNDSSGAPFCRFTFGDRTASQTSGGRTAQTQRSPARAVV